jgi:hypothetical protein
MLPVNHSNNNFQVNWGDGSSGSIVSGTAIHLYANAGLYTVTITGTFTNWTYGSLSAPSTGEANKLIEVLDWGQLQVDPDGFQFKDFSEMTVTASDPLDVSGVTNMHSMFYQATSYNENIGSWNVARVTNMQAMFYKAKSFNSSINGWNVAGVNTMEKMFGYQLAFNQDINGWNVVSLTTTESMFPSGESSQATFNQDLSSWNVAGVINMRYMFRGDAYSDFWAPFNHNINEWNVASVTNFEFMFASTEFNQNINGWNVARANSMVMMFRETRFFDQDISGWNVASATCVQQMFQQCDSSKGCNYMTQNLNAWNVVSLADSSTSPYCYNSPQFCNSCAAKPLLPA